VTVRLVELDRRQLRSRVDEVLDVYAEAMEVSPAAARSRRSIITTHLQRDGLRAVVALDGERMVGLAYGYQGGPASGGTTRCRTPSLRRRRESGWTAPSRSASCTCGRLCTAPASDGTCSPRCCPGCRRVPPSSRPPTPRRGPGRFYRDGGWVDLRRDLRFPGDPRTFAVLGLRLGSRT
jgi:hypothetical protein